MPREYLITMLLPVIGRFVNGSQTRTNTGTPTNISFFTTIIGYPSVNKSSATEAVLNACLAIGKHLCLKIEESRINCSATVESLLTELKNTWPTLIQSWNEAVTLLQSFGLYKQSGAAYDRSIMYTLYNLFAIVKRQTKSGNITVENPVLNIAAVAHPDDDGLMARFLFSAPQPSRGTKIPWINISLNHEGFNAATLHQAVANLQNERLGILTKEEASSAHRATTYFSKVPIDPKWNAE
ncbi:unnamed protein product [Rotaria sp. Silwood1]|nr:unnamed protein product [Rotaria sp. Silwood1]CAF3785517.1 unnamed protein product [Rotaria sp. Silwood1]CAF4594576.1 unnamed protein product [Rotaria sp. Silwood1]CAF4754321.1 unnamed protein product [Rotaria sp. Silwood1]CAF4913879.1 unnamed protein product [Rotaria sp. Silwood1]